MDRDTLGVLRGSTRRLRRLAEDIAAVSRAEEALDISPRPVDAGELVRSAAEHAGDRFSAKGVELDLDLGQAGLVDADPDRMAQVLGNLLDNALRHTPSGGRVTISCHARAGWTELAVADDGAGIAAEHLRHVFDRFYRAGAARDRNSGGSGIGLSIAKALVQAHGGTITVRSPGTGGGTTFVVRLPRTPR